jgi:hypothetical protein
LQILYSVTIGPQPRFLLATALIFGCSLWVYQNKDLQRAFGSVSHVAYDEGSVDAKKLLVKTEPLKFGELLPESVGQVFSSFNPGVAGILLIFSAIWRSSRITPFFFVAVAVLLFGPQFGVPGFESLPVIGEVKPQTVSLAIGLALALAGMVVDRLIAPDVPESRRW